MGRWGVLAERFRDDSDAGPPSPEEFLESNHRLFTLIGVFGALSVYLMQFERAMTDAPGGPVGASLLLFLCTSALAVRNSYRCTRRAHEHGAYLLLFGYAVFMYAFATLVASVLLLVVTRYARGAENVLSSSFVYALGFVYVPLVFRAERFRRFDGAPVAAAVGRYAPHVAAVLLAAWHAAEFRRTGLTGMQLDSGAYSVGIVLGLVAHHFLITAGVFGAA